MIAMITFRKFVKRERERVFQQRLEYSVAFGTAETTSCLTIERYVTMVTLLL